MKKKKSEMEILSPEIDVGEFKVRPWTFEQFLHLLPLLVGVVEVLKEQSISLDGLRNLKNDTQKIAQIITVIGPVIPAVVAETLKMEIKQVKEMDFDKATAVALVIFIQNAEKLKNFSGLGKTALQSLITD